MAMEKGPWMTPLPSETLISVLDHRRSRIKSDTYDGLFGILSHIFQNSKASISSSSSSQIHVAAQELNPDSGISNFEQESKDKESENDGAVGSDCMGPDDSVLQSKNLLKSFEVIGVQDRDGNDARMDIYDIELMMMGVKEDEESSRRQNIMIHDSNAEISFSRKGFARQQELIDELGNIMKGTEKLVCEDSFTATTTGLHKNQYGNDKVDLTNQEQSMDFDKKSGNTGELQVVGEQRNEQITDGFDSSSKDNVTAEVPTTPGGHEQERSLPIISLLDVKEEMHQREVKLEKVKPGCGNGGQLVPECDFCVSKDSINGAIDFCEYGGKQSSLLNPNLLESQHKEIHSDNLICGKDVKDSPNHSIKDGEIEEGEISGEEDFESFDRASKEDSVLEEEKAEEELKAKLVIENGIFPSDTGIEEQATKFEFSTFTEGTHQKAGIGGEVDPIESDEYRIPHRVAINLPEETMMLEKSGVVSKEIASGNTGIMSLEKEQDSTKCKKKRGPVSEKKKAKKKEKKRKKRAEKNRQLGVKRLKLHPVSKPKTVEICCHYLKGRCQQGDMCKFSHDAVPLTKSKPCCHFARKSCMKGDDCPFDHQLSKYLCTNFVSNGFCSRGGDCMFSHKIPSKEDSSAASNISKPELKPPSMLGNKTLNGQPNTSVSIISQKIGLSNSFGTYVLGVNVHNVTESVHQEPSITPKGISFLNMGKSLDSSSKIKQVISPPKLNGSVRVQNQKDQSALGASPNINEILMKTASIAPKGFNFLSFGGSSIGASRSNFSAGVQLKESNATSFSPLGNVSLSDKANLSLSKDGHMNVGETNRRAPEAVESSNEMLMKTQSVVSTKGVNFLFPQKALANVSNGNKQGDSVNRYVQKGVNASEKSPLLASPLAFGQSSESCVQKAYFSTLAFAAKHGSGIKMKSSLGIPASCTDVHKDVAEMK